MTDSYTLDTRSHAFNVGIAIDYSPSISLWLAHLAYWSEKNLANNRHIYDGHVWCYDTLEAIGDYFPYFTKRQLETIINNSVEAGLVIKGNYNQTQYDRTCWYALTPKAFAYFKHLSSKKYLNRLYLSISQKCEMDFAEWCNGFHRNVTPIPDTDPDTDPTTTTTKEDIDTPKQKESSSSSSFENDCLKERIIDDKRTDDEFLENIRHHIEHNSDKTKPLAQRELMLLKLLKTLRARNHAFVSNGFVTVAQKNELEKKQSNKELLYRYQEWVSKIKSGIDLGLLLPSSPIFSFEEWCLSYA